MLPINRVAGSLLSLVLLLPVAASRAQAPGAALRINEEGYFEAPGINVMLFDDFYPEGHQGGLTIIQNGARVAANGEKNLFGNELMYFQPSDELSAIAAVEAHWRAPRPGSCQSRSCPH